MDGNWTTFWFNLPVGSKAELHLKLVMFSSSCSPHQLRTNSPIKISGHSGFILKRYRAVQEDFTVVSVHARNETTKWNSCGVHFNDE